MWFLFKMRKKGQFDLLPVFFSLIFVFLLMVFGLIIYFNYWKNKILEHSNFIRQIGYYSLGEQIISLPLLNCGYFESQYGCLDLFKIKSFNKTLVGDKYYRNVLKGIFFKYGQKRVRVELVIDKGNNNFCSLGDLDNCFYYGSCNCGVFVLYDMKKEDFFSFEEKSVLIYPVLVRYREESEEKNFDYKLCFLKIISFY